MNNNDKEKEWLMHLVGRHSTEGSEVERETMTLLSKPKVETQHTLPKAKTMRGNGLADVAGMEGLKQVVRENFVNVVRHKGKVVLRTGRIDEMIYIDMPGMAARHSLFELELAKLPIDSDIDIKRLATPTEGETADPYVLMMYPRFYKVEEGKDMLAPCLCAKLPGD